VRSVIMLRWGSESYSIIPTHHSNAGGVGMMEYDSDPNLRPGAATRTFGDP